MPIFRQLFVSCLCLAALSETPAHAEPELNSAQMLIGLTQTFLEQKVESYLQASNIEGRSEISINRLDGRLRLAPCEQTPNLRLEHPAQPIGRVTVRVRCDGASPWTIFVPAQVKLYRAIVISTRPLKRQSVLQPADLQLSERDVGLLGQGYLTDLEQAIGHKLTRPLMSDQVVAPSAIEQAELVRRGDQVMISAGGTGMSVKMPGEALSDGAQGIQIRVRNLSSGRIIKARVVAAGQVEVDL